MREGGELRISRGIHAASTRPSLVGALVWLLQRALQDLGQGLDPSAPQQPLEPAWTPGPGPQRRHPPPPPQGPGGRAEQRAPGQGAGGGAAAGGAAPQQGGGMGQQEAADPAPQGGGGDLGGGGDAGGLPREEALGSADVGGPLPPSPRAGAATGSTGGSSLGGSLGSSASASSLGSLRYDLVMHPQCAAVLWNGPNGIIYHAV